jgi:hypothetical protein
MISFRNHQNMESELLSILNLSLMGCFASRGGFFFDEICPKIYQQFSNVKLIQNNMYISLKIQYLLLNKMLVTLSKNE